MSTEITVAFVKEFTDGITLLQQQMGSNLRRGVSMKSNITGDRAFFDQVDATSMSQITTRHGDTTLTDTPHRRRMVTLAPYEVADLVDRADQIRTLNDPTNSYVKSFAAAAGRTVDDLVIAAFDATSATGVDGSGTALFPAANIVPVNGTGMNVDKIRNARDILEGNENMEDDGENEWFIVMSSVQRMALLTDPEVTSSDFATIKALVNGQINQFMGFTFLKSQRLVDAGSNVLECYAWVKSSMKLGIGQEPRGFIDVLPGKRHSTQVRYELDAGATRMDEKGVVQILVDES